MATTPSLQRMADSQVSGSRDHLQAITSPAMAASIAMATMNLMGAQAAPPAAGWSTL